MNVPSDFHAAILAALGYAPEAIEPGKFQRFGPRRSGWSKLFDDLRGGVFGCYRQSVSETWSAIDRRSMSRTQRVALACQVEAAARERQAAQREEWEANARRITDTLRQSVPLAFHDPAALYMRRRIGDVWPLPACLRLHRALPYWHEGEKLGSFPTILAPVKAPDGRIVAVHRTALNDSGRKADVPEPKKLTRAAGPLAGACIRLHHPMDGCIGVAEGIETALAAWCASGMPTVAAYCAGSLAAWQWPTSVQRLVIFADADKAGRKAAETLQSRAVRAGLRVSLLMPTTEGADWCDVWAASPIAAEEAA